MSSKLQELTDRLYNEGLSKGQAEGERILEKARQESEGIIENARKEAASIMAEADRCAEDLRSKTQSDVRMASQQCIQATRKDIENLIVAKVVSPVSDLLSDTVFLREIITSVAERFSPGEPCDINLILPDRLKSELEPWVETELSRLLSGSVHADFSKKIQAGFTIGPADGSYFVSMTDDTFRQLIAEYLRPVTRKLLFGE